MLKCFFSYFDILFKIIDNEYVLSFEQAFSFTLRSVNNCLPNLQVLIYHFLFAIFLLLGTLFSSIHWHSLQSCVCFHVSSDSSVYPTGEQRSFLSSSFIPCSQHSGYVQHMKCVFLGWINESVCYSHSLCHSASLFSLS